MTPESTLRVTHDPTAAFPAEGARPSFFFDLGDPESYLAAERLATLLPLTDWIPVAATGLPEGPFADRPGRRAAIEALAAKRGLRPLRWPAGWPGKSRRPLLAATYARQVGRADLFSLAAFRHAFGDGRDLTDDETLRLVAHDCELHPEAIPTALARTEALAEALDHATITAVAARVRRVPALVWEGQVYHGVAGVDVLADAIQVQQGRAAAIAEALARRGGR